MGLGPWKLPPTYQTALGIRQAVPSSREEVRSPAHPIACHIGILPGGQPSLPGQPPAVVPGLLNHNKSSSHSGPIVMGFVSVLPSVHAAIPSHLDTISGALVARL